MKIHHLRSRIMTIDVIESDTAVLKNLALWGFVTSGGQRIGINLWATHAWTVYRGFPAGVLNSLQINTSWPVSKQPQARSRSPHLGQRSTRQPM